MPAIPEFVLRKLFVPGSLKPGEVGFTFELNNVFAPVTLAGLGISTDNLPVSLENIFISMPGQDALSASGIGAQNPFQLPVNVVISVRVNAPAPQKKLNIRAETREAGVLQFTIVPGRAARRPGAIEKTLKRLARDVRNVGRAFRVQHDAQRPALHFTPPANWMNDPNGLIYWRGNYHLFYQYNPDEAAWGNIHWGHAVSKDMLCWKHLPIALAPDPDGADAGGCFSGCAVDYEGALALLYTGVFPERQCLALCASADLVSWRKNPQPVIPAAPDGLSLEGFRDPCVWKEGKEWRMALGSGLRGVGGAVLLYRSVDLVRWEYEGILFQGDTHCREPYWSGVMWECPSFFPLGKKWVLIFSVLAAEGGLYTLYYSGEYRNNHFVPDGDARLVDWGAGGCFYAPQTFLDKQGRRVMLGWLRETREPAEQVSAGWSGAMSFPRLLSIADNGELLSAPLEKISTLRKNHERLTRPGQISERVKGACLEICMNIPAGMQGTAGWVGVILAPGGESKTCVKVGYDDARGILVADCSLAGGLLSEIPIGSVSRDDLTLRIFIDGSVLEIFTEGCQPLSARFYLPKMRDLRVQNSGFLEVEIWSLDI